jgi:predicted AlkP superfamily phosphohydrolase/phosphomutase
LPAPIGDSAWAKLQDLRWIYAADETYRRVAGALYRRGDFDVFSVYFRGLDAVSHKYWQYFKPAGVTLIMKPWEIAMMERIVPTYYEYVDELLGAMLELVDPATRVIVCSDHGFHGYRRTREGLSVGIGMHSDEGVLVMAGPELRGGAQLTRAEVKDIMPTILALAGVPPANDLDGHILGEAFAARHRKWLDKLLEHAVDSYEPLVPRRQGEGTFDPAVEEGILRQLRALGYIE